MNILLINHYAGSAGMGMEFRPYYMAREWIRSGHNVLIVTSSFHHVRRVQPGESGKAGYCTIEGVDYMVIKTPKYRGNGVGRIVNMLFFVGRLMLQSRKIALRFKPDIVIASSTYPSDIYPARKIARISGAKLVFEVHDLWPLSPMLLGGYSRKHPFIIFMQHGENFACRNCDILISMLPCTKPHFLKHGLDESKWFHVPNGIDPTAYEETEELPADFHKTLNNIKNEYRFVVMYTGSHGIANSLDIIIDSTQFINNHEVAVVFVGKGPEKSRLVDKAKMLNRNNIFFLDPVNKNAVPKLLEMADILLIALSMSELFKYGVSPNKLFDYMMASKPVVYAVIAGNDIVKEARCGISCDPGDPRSVAEAIKELCSLSPGEREQLGKNGKDFVLKNHTYKKLASQFMGICINN